MRPGARLAPLVVMACVMGTSRGTPPLSLCLLVSQPDEAVPEEAPRRPPREAWPLARVLGLCW